MTPRRSPAPSSTDRGQFGDRRLHDECSRFGGGRLPRNRVVLTSATYPLWQGHIKALETSGLSASPPTPIVTLWDAGNVLTNPDLVTKPWQPTPATRKLYTWDPSDGHLIEIIAANEPAITALCGAPCATTPPAPPIPMNSVIDFMRGNDGTETNKKRNWLLGPSINVTPAIVGPAQKYFQSGNVVNHKPFEALYTSRRALAWLGADDGFLHAFDLDDGAEVVGLLPPNLIANQVDLYNKFLDPDNGTDTGQDVGFLFEEHTWGVASSLRFADVWFPACLPSGCYKTVGLLTEGPGGNVVAAIDITHPYPGRAVGPLPHPAADKNYGVFPDNPVNTGKPVDIIWTAPGTVPAYPGLFGTWSVPAVAADAVTTSKMMFGAGINPDSLYNNGQKDANVFVVDPLDGTLLSTRTIHPLASPSPLVGHQTFTDSVFFQTGAPNFQNDNLANLALQGDENGRLNAVWATSSNPWTNPNSAVLIDLNAAAGGIPQPLYYSPAANGIGPTGFQIYALGSGSFYETSPAVSGWNVNRIGDPPVGSGFDSSLPVFVPTLFVATNPHTITDVAFAPIVAPNVISQPIAGIPLQPTDPTYSLTSVPPHTSLGIHTQVTSSPLLVGDPDSTKPQDVFFTVFDPDIGCHGFSYVIKVEFAIDAAQTPTVQRDDRLCRQRGCRVRIRRDHRGRLRRAERPRKERGVARPGRHSPSLAAWHSELPPRVVEGAEVTARRRPGSFG